MVDTSTPLRSSEPESDVEDEGLIEFRCSLCGARTFPQRGKLLAKIALGPGSVIEVKCPRCKGVNKWTRTT